MKQDTRWIILGLCLVAFFALSLVISFNSGLKQGVKQSNDCYYQGGVLVFEGNSLKCVKNDTKISNNFNFSGVDLG